MFQRTRRDLLKAAGIASGAVMCGAAVPSLLRQAAAATNGPGRILVVIELAGGNDGLNTIVPYRDPGYQKARPRLAIAAAETLKVNDELGLHPGLRGMAELLEQGHFAAIQGVGYENPNRSHFESMDIWHSCQRKGVARTDGWLGRYLETAGARSPNDPPAIHVGGESQPLALMSREVRVPSIESIERFRIQGVEDASFRAAVQDLTTSASTDAGDLLGFVASSTSSALAASQRMEVAEIRYAPAAPYPPSGLGRKLETIAKLIAAGMETAVYYVRLDGFDTHANQLAAHDALLRELGDAVRAFLQDQIAHGEGDRVLTFCFSEFGRRVAENASQGTDHGTAGPVLVAGTGIQAGVIGRKPSLSDLDHGDLKYHTDFRQVYATILEHWLQVPSREILRGAFEPVPLFA